MTENIPPSPEPTNRSPFLSTYGLKSTDPAYLGYFADDGTTKIDNADYNVFLANYGKKLSGFTATI